MSMIRNIFVVNKKRKIAITGLLSTILSTTALFTPIDAYAEGEQKNFFRSLIKNFVPNLIEEGYEILKDLDRITDSEVHGIMGLERILDKNNNNSTLDKVVEISKTVADVVDIARAGVGILHTLFPTTSAGAGDEAPSFYDNQIDSEIYGKKGKYKYNSWAKFVVAKSKDKSESGSKTNTMQSRVGGSIAVSEDYFLGAYIAYNQMNSSSKIYSGKRQAIGVALSADSTLADNLKLRSTIYKSGGDFKHTLFKIPGAEKAWFNGTQKIDNLRFNNSVQYTQKISDNFTLVPVLGVNVLRTFSTDYYARNAMHDVITVNTKPYTEILGLAMLHGMALLSATESYMTAIDVYAGVQRDIYKHRKAASMYTLRISDQTEGTTSIMDNKVKKSTVFIVGAALNGFSTDQSYNLGLGYNYSQHKKVQAHQATLNFKFNF